MANRVTIDVEARFVDHVTTGMDSASKSSDKLKKSVEKANKELDKTAKKNVKPKLGADDNAFTKKIRQAQSKADKFGKTKVSATLGAIDKASAKIGKVTGAARSFASKTFKGAISVADKASSVIGSVTGAARTFAGKTFRATVKIVDYATTPLRKIKESLFSIKTLVAAVTAGFATKQFVVNPINLADQYSSAKIGFSTLLGESEGQAMMNDIDQFAKETPFKTSGVISNVQKMMAYGWDASKVISDMETIGDAAAATGKGDEGLESIVYALSEIRSKGKLSTQELNQLASAGIKAKQYLAQGLGYGTDDAGLMKLSEALEDGAIGANQAIELILQGMEEFDGMMDKTANETVSGLWSQIQDTFEINVFRKWGQGLQDGAKKGFGSIVELLNTSESALEDFGDMVYEIGRELSNWAADKLEKTVQLIKEITATDTWKNASLGGKIKILWDEIIAEPFSDWWNSKGKKWIAEKAEKLGKGLGSGITKGFLALLGIDIVGIADEGISIGSSFAKGFSEGFDGSAITDALVDAISNVWQALPTWAKLLIGTYGVGKATSGIGNLVGGIGNIVGGVKNVASLIGSPGNAMVQGTGLLNLFANTGYALSGGAATSTLSAGGAALAGGASITGGIIAGATTIKGGYDLYNSYKAYKAGDDVEGKANLASGGSALGGVAAGAAIGTLIGGPVGTLIGAGIGGLVGWIGGDKWAEKIRTDAEAAKFESEEMKEAIKDSEMSAEELAMTYERIVNQGISEHFGDIKLSLEEIQAIADKVVIGDNAGSINTFIKSIETAKTSLSSMQTAVDSLDRLNWKIGLGLKLDETEIEEYKTAIDTYIASAEKYVEDKHYEFTAAITLLMDVKEGDGKTLLENGNTYYSSLKEQIDGLSSELSSTVEIALKDGVITLDEEAEILNLQNQIAEITNKLAEAESDAGFEAIKIKFGSSNISDESFYELQQALNEQMAESMGTYDNALTIGLTNLQLQYDDGLIDETEYARLKGILEETYNSQIEELELKVQQVQVDIIGEAFQDDLGTDIADKLNIAIQQSLNEGINPATWDADDVRKFLNMEDLSDDMAGQISKLLSGMEFTVEALPNIVLRAGAFLPEQKELANQVNSYIQANPISAEADANVNVNPLYALDPITFNEYLQTKNFDESKDAAITINPTYSLLNTWKAPCMSQTIYPTITVSPNYITSSASNSLIKSSGPYRQNANGSIVQSKTLSWIGEEGPEAIIPLVPGRRSRGLKLWEEAGRRLGVQYHAEGGIVGGESTPIQPFKGEISTAKENKIEINMGGVTIEIKTDGNKSVKQSIEEQEQEIAEKVAEIFKNVLSAQFANIPLRGGT